MHRDGHLGIAFLLYAPIVATLLLLNTGLSVLVLVGALEMMVLCMFPDHDLTLRKYRIPLINTSAIRRRGFFTTVGTTAKRVIPFVSNPPSRDLLIYSRPLTKHRGFTHTVWFALGVGGFFYGLSIGLLMLLESMNIQLLTTSTHFASIFIGLMGTYAILTHIIGDLLTPMGIKPFAPLSEKQYSLTFCRADGRLCEEIFPTENAGGRIRRVIREEIHKRHMWNGAFLIIGSTALGIAYFVPIYPHMEGTAALLKHLVDALLTLF